MINDETPIKPATPAPSEPAVHSSVGLERTASLCDEDEQLIEQCIEIIKHEGQAKVSLFQRRLRLGYIRAARIMDELERRKIVGPATDKSGVLEREILIPHAL